MANKLRAINLWAFLKLGELDLIKEHLDQTDNQISNELSEASADLEKRRQAGEGMLSEGYERVLFRRDSLKEILYFIFRYSAIVSLYSFLESYLCEKCNIESKRKSQSIGIKDLKGEGILRARNFLAKVCGLPFPDSSNAWQELNKFRLIRNLVIHAQGNLKFTESPEKVRKVISNSKHVRLDNEDLLVVEKGYIDASYDHIYKLVYSLDGT